MEKIGFWGALKTVHDTARKADKRGYYLFLFLSVLCTFRVFVELASTEWVINSVYSLALGEQEWKYVVCIIVGFGVLKGIFMLLELLKGRVELGFVYSLNYYTRDTLNSKLADVKMEYFESHESMVRIHDVKSRMEEIFPKYVRSIAAYITALPLLLIYSAYLSRVNPWYVLTYLILFVVFNGFLTRKFSGIWSCWDAVQKYDQKQKYYFGLCGDKISHQEYRANRLFGYFTKLWEGAFQDCYRERMKIFRKFEVNLQMSRILFNIPFIVMLALLAFEVLDGKLQVGFLIIRHAVGLGMPCSLRYSAMALLDEPCRSME